MTVNCNNTGVGCNNTKNCQQSQQISKLDVELVKTLLLFKLKLQLNPLMICRVSKSSSIEFWDFLIIGLML